MGKSGFGWKRWILAAMIGLGASTASAARLALVVGNDAYQYVRPLTNAVADAKAMGEALRDPALGFTRVDVVTNATRADLNDRIRDLAGAVSGGDEVVVYFAGHGVQLAGVSYLLPVDTRDQDATQVRDDALALQRLLDDIDERRPRFTLVIVDACRDNPFGTRVRAAGTRGLAPTTPANGQMVIYAAGANQRALDRLGSDDASRNGLFTRVWLQAMQAPGVPVHELARTVRVEVKRLAESVGHVQVPALYDQSLGTFVFRSGGSVAQAPAPAPVAPTPANPPPREARAEPPPLPAAVPPKEFPPAKVFRDCDGCPEMVVIPAGVFEMGSRDGEGDDDETPAHPVRIAPFALGRLEITQGQWRAVMDTQPSHFRRCGEDCPVENVSWEDAQAFVAKLNKRVSGKATGPYRLPSEAEWEYACRSGGEGRYCGTGDADGFAWFIDNSGERSRPAGRKAANRFGLHDMSGNVAEWVEDCWNAGYAGAPADGRAWSSGECARRVIRGGAWVHDTRNLRAADRSGDTPDRRSVHWGFRVARAVP